MERNNQKIWWIGGTLIGLALVAFLVWGDTLRMAGTNRQFRSGAVDQARAAYQALKTAHPDSPAILHNLGLCDFQQAGYERSLEPLRQAVQLLDRPEAAREKAAHGATLYYHLGNALFKAAEKSAQPADGYQEALANFKRAILADPQDAAAKYNYELTRLRLAQARNQQQNQPDARDQKQNQNQNPNQPNSGNQKNSNPSESGKDNNDSSGQASAKNGSNRPQSGKNRAGSSAGNDAGAASQSPGSMTKEEAAALLKMSENGALYQGPVVHDNRPTAQDW